MNDMDRYYWLAQTKACLEKSKRELKDSKGLADMWASLVDLCQTFRCLMVLQTALNHEEKLNEKGLD